MKTHTTIYDALRAARWLIVAGMVLVLAFSMAGTALALWGVTTLVAPDTPETPPGIQVVPAATLAEAVRLCHGGGLGRPLAAVV